jgi:hypothetical protein
LRIVRRRDLNARPASGSWSTVSADSSRGVAYAGDCLALLPFNGLGWPECARATVIRLVSDEIRASLHPAQFGDPE